VTVNGGEGRRWNVRDEDGPQVDFHGNERVDQDARQAEFGCVELLPKEISRDHADGEATEHVQGIREVGYAEEPEQKSDGDDKA
jgi:hypothetical protein